MDNVLSALSVALQHHPHDHTRQFLASYLNCAQYFDRNERPALHDNWTSREGSHGGMSTVLHKHLIREACREHGT